MFLTFPVCTVWTGISCVISSMFLLFQGVIQGANYLSQEGTSPPEAAIEATPETTPVRVSTRQNYEAVSFTSKNRNIFKIEHLKLTLEFTISVNY